jgi:hypothetical protein
MEEGLGEGGLLFMLLLDLKALPRRVRLDDV